MRERDINNEREREIKNEREGSESFSKLCALTLDSFQTFTNVYLTKCNKTVRQS